MPTITDDTVFSHSVGAAGEWWIVNPDVMIGGFVNLGHINVSLDNKGAIVGTSNAAAVGTMGDFSLTKNWASGLIFASNGPAITLLGSTDFGRNPRVINDGHIISAAGNGVEFENISIGGSLENKGTITSNKKAAIAAVDGGLAAITNSGDLFGHEAIVLTGASEDTLITNTGRIEAEVYAIRTQDGYTFRLVNSGVVDGIISARSANGSDRITNSGQMLKNVVLAGGDDTYTGTGTGFAYRVYGEEGVDKLTGSAAADTFYGGSENDVLNGGGGNDWLMGQTGVDRLTGGAGNDVFVFAYAPSPTTRGLISDFNVGNDTIRLEDTIFTKVGAVGALKAGAFALSTATKAADDRIIYNKVSGALFYDSDGSGAAVAVQFATLQNKPTITALDFVVI